MPFQLEQSHWLTRQYDAAQYRKFSHQAWQRKLRLPLLFAVGYIWVGILFLQGKIMKDLSLFPAFCPAVCLTETGKGSYNIELEKKGEFC